MATRWDWRYARGRLCRPDGRGRWVVVWRLASGLGAAPRLPGPPSRLGRGAAPARDSVDACGEVAEVVGLAARCACGVRYARATARRCRSKRRRLRHARTAASTWSVTSRSWYMADGRAGSSAAWGALATSPSSFSTRARDARAWRRTARRRARAPLKADCTTTAAPTSAAVWPWRAGKGAGAESGSFPVAGSLVLDLEAPSPLPGCQGDRGASAEAALGWSRRDESGRWGSAWARDLGVAVASGDG